MDYNQISIDELREEEGNVVYLTGMGNTPYTKGQKWKVPKSVRSKIKK